MISLVQITDLHLTENKKTRVKFWDTHSSFRSTLDYIKSNEHPDFLIASGDISNDGTKKSYIAYQKELKRFDKPVLTILGNHDNRKNYQAVFQTQQTIHEKAIHLLDLSLEQRETQLFVQDIF